MAEIRPPWADRIGKIPLTADTLGSISYWATVLHTAIERGREHLAGDALAVLMTLEDGLSKSGLGRGSVMAAAGQAGVRLDLDLYQAEKEAYIDALLKGNIGEWSPVEANYPGFMALRAHFYRRPNPLPPGVSQVYAPTMANERRLSVGDVLPSFQPGQEKMIRTSNMPAPCRQVAGYATDGFMNQWWQRKVVHDRPLEEQYRGEILHWP